MYDDSASSEADTFTLVDGLLLLTAIPPCRPRFAAI